VTVTIAVPEVSSTASANSVVTTSDMPIKGVKVQRISPLFVIVRIRHSM